MNRIHRFSHHRFIGTRDDRLVYDCDDQAQFDRLRRRLEEEELFGKLLLSSFAPDSLAEARNRGFRPA